MAVLPILIAPHPVLKTVADPVERIDDDVLRLLDDMLDTMYDAPGIGLAAPQIGVSRRVVVIDLARDGEPPAPMRLINPEILWESEDISAREEGCLSVPDIYAEVERPAVIGLRFTDETGAAREIEAGGLLATCIQHEIDHLDGVMFYDHLSTLKRGMILKKMKKLKTRLAED